MMFSQLAAKNISDGTFEAGKLSIKDTNGVIKSGSTGASLYSTSTSAETVGNNLTGASGSNTNGIQVGSGTDAVSFEDFELQTLITNGTEAGQLNYVQSELKAKVLELEVKKNGSRLIKNHMSDLKKPLYWAAG
ncbi:unnamed protein product, partial [marine sediment metagenome]